MKQGLARARLRRVLRSELLWVALFAGLSLWVHAKYRLSGFGEQDAARLGRDAIVWHLKNEITSIESGYRMHTSPGYIHLLKFVMDHGLKIKKLPAFMNSLSVALGTACAVALYALFRQFSAPRYAGLAVLMYLMTPGFWLGSIYGMPTIPALCGFTLSVLWFVRASRLRTLRSVWLPVLIAASFACLFWAISFKADLVLCTGVFLVAALAARGRRWPMLALASLVVLGSVLVDNRYSHAMLITPPDTPQSTAAFLESWNHQFPFKLAALLDPGNNQTIVNCAGGLLFSVLVVSALASLFAGGRAGWLAVGALAWAVPPVLFWGLLYGNHSRHSVFGIAPLFLVASQFVFRAVGDRALRGWLLGLLLAFLSYFSDPNERGTVTPASNLLESAERLESVIRRHHDDCRAVALNPSLKRVVVGGDVLAPYLDFEIFAAAKHPVMTGSWEMRDGPQVTIFAHTRSKRQGGDTMRKFSREGYAVLSR